MLHVADTIWWEIFAGAKFWENASRLFRRNFHGFYFVERMHNALTTPLPVDGHAWHANWRNDTEWQSEKACATTITKYQDCCRRWRNSLLSGRIQHHWSQLQKLWSVSKGFVGILYTSRLIFLHSNHLKVRQTVENHLVYTGTSSYRCICT